MYSVYILVHDSVQMLYVDTYSSDPVDVTSLDHYYPHIAYVLSHALICSHMITLYIYSDYTRVSTEN